jgi:UDP-glucose:(heptosyl)LPS alpha-1,3-glucosyltransferase
MLRDGGARAVIVNSRLVAGEITAQYGYPAERQHLVYNGVPAPMPLEIQSRLRAEVRRELGLAENAYAVLFAGSGWERKGLADAIHAADRASSQPTLLIAGSGSRRRMPASDRTRYLGPVPGLARVLAAADCFILPTRYDPFSNACLEALAAGVPVITSTANGFSEILTPETGGAVPDPVEVPALAAAIDHWSDPHRRDPARIRAHAAAFTVERNLAETMRVLENLA